MHYVDGDETAQPGAHADSHKAGGGDTVPHDDLAGAGSYSHAEIDAHLDAEDNPHGVTATQVGSDAAGSPRPPTAHASTHEQGGTDEIAHQSLAGAGTQDHAAIDAHIVDTDNPHSVTAEQTGGDAAGTPRPPTPHADSHAHDGSDPVDASTLAGAGPSGGVLVSNGTTLVAIVPQVVVVVGAESGPGKSSASVTVVPGMAATLTACGLLRVRVRFSASLYLASGCDGIIAIYKDGVEQVVRRVGHVATLGLIGLTLGLIRGFPCEIEWIDESPSAGEHTYDVRWTASSGTIALNSTQYRLRAEESV